VILELDKAQYQRVRSLFKGLHYQLITAAVLDGTSPGRIWVDDRRQPGTAFMASAEGYFLTGYEGNTGFNHALPELLASLILAGDTLREGENALVVVCHPDAWHDQLGGILKGRVPIRERRLHYLFDRPQLDWRSQVPTGFTVARIDERLLSRPGVVIPEHVTGWMQANWGSVEGFYQNGFGFCTMHGQRLVSWCLADCATGSACEIGIHTAEDHRRRGLAALTTAATVDHCLSRGLTTVGWHCHEDNWGSRGVAEKVGFVVERDYVHHLFIFDEAQHLAWQGYHSFADRRHREAIEWFAKAFEAGDPPGWAYHTAARAWAVLGDPDAAFRNLHRAIDRGWTHADVTRRCKEFESLHGQQGWNHLLGRLGGHRNSQ
jgi:RimJ/RimL family protein N-acetyltransferase